MGWILLRADVRIRTKSAAGESGRATNLATHPPILDVFQYFLEAYSYIYLKKVLGKDIKYWKPVPVHFNPRSIHYPVVSEKWALSFKGKVSRDGYFWRSKHFNQYFLCIRWWFSRSFKSFSLPYPIINFVFASLKLLTNFENACWNPPQYSLLCDWSMFSSTDLSLAEVKCARNNLSQAASGMILQNHRRLPVSKIAALGS
jgi:hypothetical protein